MNTLQLINYLTYLTSAQNLSSEELSRESEKAIALATEKLSKGEIESGLKPLFIKALGDLTSSCRLELVENKRSWER